ncbi:dynein intermediate chain, putative [Plasmodium vivax]|nr:dynein intermediate chain, putative [Plasmodium vivax]
MKANAVEKKKKKKLQSVGGEAKGAEGDGLENEKRKASIQNGKNETFTRFLFPKNPRAFANLVEFSFSNEEFTSVDQVDHTVFHLDMQSCLVMRDSDEGRKQVELVKKKIEKANSFTVLKDNDYVYHKPKNCFDYIDRYAQTVPVSFKDEATKTEPQEINEICDTVCQSIIYDAYLHEFQKVSNEEDKEKDRYNENAKDEDDRGKKYDSSGDLGLDADSDVGSGNLSDDAKFATVLFSSGGSSEEDSDAVSEEDTGSADGGSWKSSSAGDYDVEEGEHDGGSDEQLAERGGENPDEGVGDGVGDGVGLGDVPVAVAVGETHGGAAEAEEHGGDLLKKGHNNDANGAADAQDIAAGAEKADEPLEKGKTATKGAPKGKGKIGERNNTRQGPAKSGTKKKKKESFSGKHELYFINYKDMKEKIHKELNFIYKDEKVKKSDEKILQKKRFLKTLKLMDRIYNKNNEEEIYLNYKSEMNKNILTKLWIFSLPFFTQLIVTDIKFHPFYEDLFAMSFKNSDIKINTGILSCYSFKNTKSPEHVLKTDFPIYSIEWSAVNHSVIIIGLSNGNICIYDLKKKKNERLIFESNIKQIYNRDIISQISFDRKNKSFYSISYDGNMFCWKYNNKFTVGDKLLTLKKDWDDDFKDPLNFVQTQSITCIDFNPFQKNLFLIGTTKGKIYLYSSTFSDNHLRLYNEHSMSVNAVSYNPFRRGIFISASYDWTIRIWDQARPRSLLVLDIKECVYDVRWSPIVSTCFLVISSDSHGHLHIYDLSLDINKAIITEVITRKKKLRKLCVNQFNEVILIGDESGLLHSYKVSYAFNASYVDYLRGKLGRSFQVQMMNSFLTKVQ